MDEDPLQEGLESLSRIEEDIEEIKERSATPRRAFYHGVLQGAGAVLGGILAIIVLGWVLFLFGIVPGLSSIADAIREAMHEAGR